MTPRLSVRAVLIVCILALAGCREEPRKLSPKTEDLLRAKADEKIASILRQPEPPRFVAVTVFNSDVFLHQSATLERYGISLLDSFDNVAVLLLDADVTSPLLKEGSVRKVRYLCTQRMLARIHPAFLMSTLRLFGADKEKDPVPFFIRYRGLPTDKEVRAVQDAGFDVTSRDGAVLTVSGPPDRFFRLLEMDGIIYYEGASNLRTL